MKHIIKIYKEFISNPYYMPKKKYINKNVNKNKNKNKIVININSNNKKRVTKSPPSKQQQSMPFIINNPSHLPYTPQQNPYINGAMANNAYGIGDTKLLNAIQGSLTDIQMKQDSQNQEILNTRQHNEELRSLLGRRAEDRRAASKNEYLDPNYSDHKSEVSFNISESEPLDNSSYSTHSIHSYEIFDKTNKLINAVHRPKAISYEAPSTLEKLKKYNERFKEPPDTHIVPYFTAPKTNTLEGESEGTKRMNEMQSRNLKPELNEEEIEQIKQPKRRGRKRLEQTTELTTDEILQFRRNANNEHKKKQYRDKKMGQG